MGAGAQVLGGFAVGDGARIGSNAVVVKPVPAGATAVGNPARIIEADESEHGLKPMTDNPAYAVDPRGPDPISQVMQTLIAHVAEQDARINQLCRTLESMGSHKQVLSEPIDKEKLNKMAD